MPPDDVFSLCTQKNYPLHDRNRSQSSICRFLRWLSRTTVPFVQLFVYIIRRLTYLLYFWNFGVFGDFQFIIGSAEALPILCVRCARWKRERERERERYRERKRDRRKWRHHCRAKIGDEFTLSHAKNSHNCCEFTLSLAKKSHFSLLPSHFLSHHCGAEIHTCLCQKIRPLCSDSLLNGASCVTSDRKPKTNDQILPSPIVLPIEKMNQINTKNYWKIQIEKEIVCEVARGDKPYMRKSTDRKAQIRKAFVQFSGLICALRSVDFLM